MKKGTVGERAFVWACGVVGYVFVYTLTQMQIPLNNVSIPLQWASVALSFIGGALFLYWGFLAVRLVRYTRK